MPFVLYVWICERLFVESLAILAKERQTILVAVIQLDVRNRLSAR